MVARDVRKNLNLFVDGRGYAGQIDEFNAPVMEAKLEEFRAGGMAGPVEIVMGHEKLNADFGLFAYDADVLANFGVVEGRTIGFIAREQLESHDGTVTPVVHHMRGHITKIEPGTSKAGAINPLKVTMSLSYYKLTHGARLLHEVDVENMVWVSNGVDLLAAARNALGI